MQSISIFFNYPLIGIECLTLKLQRGNGVWDMPEIGQITVYHLISTEIRGGGQMALPLNLNAKNIPIAHFFSVFKIDVYFLWSSASELQLKTSANNSTLFKEKGN